MDRFLPRKYNNPVFIGMGVLLIVALATIIYLLRKDQTPTPVQKRAEIETSSTLSGSTKPTLVLYWAKWCGICVSIKDEWNKAASILKEDGNFDVIEFEADDDSEEVQRALKHFSTTNDKLAGYPDIRLFPEGYNFNKPSIQYKGERTEENFLKFVYTGK